MKKLIAFTLAVVSLVVAVSMMLSVTAATTYIRGDADGDGVATIMDATVIQRKLTGMEVVYINERAGDVDGSGLSITDVTFIQRYLAGLENMYHINEPVTIPDPTEPAPTAPPATKSPYELPFIPNN